MEYTGKWLPVVLGSEILWVSTWGYFSEWILLSSLFLNSVIFSSLWCSSSVKKGVLHIFAHSFYEFWFWSDTFTVRSKDCPEDCKSERCLYTYVPFYHRGVINTNEHLCFRFSDDKHPKSKPVHEIPNIFHKLGRASINCFTYIFFPLDDHMFWMIIAIKKNFIHSVWYKSGYKYMHAFVHIFFIDLYKCILISDAFLVSVWSCGFILMISLSYCFLV